MVIEYQTALEENVKKEALRILNVLGKYLWKKFWQEDMNIPSNLNVFTGKDDEKEYILRYLFLRVLLNQQGDSLLIRKFARNLVEELGHEFLRSTLDMISTPDVYSKMIEIARKYGGEKCAKIYSPGRFRGIKPFYILTSRISLFAIFLEMLKKKKTTILEIVRHCLKDKAPVISLNRFISNCEYVGFAWVGKNPKGSRMLTDWIIFLMTEIWKEFPSSLMTRTLMIVDGHVGKVFSRIGLISRIAYDRSRPYIIEAAQMRGNIENEVKKYITELNLIPFYVDYAAFCLGISICDELKPICEISNPNERKHLIQQKEPYSKEIISFSNYEGCPLEHICKKYTKWTAYKQKKS